jgi:hypothetical protein
MKLGRTTALVVAALVAGLVAGNVASVVAAPESEATTSGMGLKLGSAMRDAGARLADIVAGLTGLDAADVRTQRESGTSFAAIAAAKGIDTAALVESAMKVRTDVLAKKVEDGTITQDQADAAAERMKARITERVESTGDPREGRGKGGQGGQGGMRRGSQDGSRTGLQDGSGASAGGRGQRRADNGGVCPVTPADVQ